MRTVQSGRRGVGLADVVVVGLVLLVVALLLVTVVPRWRSQARELACGNNLRQIGVALALYDQRTGHLPVIPPLDPAPLPGSGPLAALLAELGVADFEAFEDLQTARVPGPDPIAARPRRIPGLLCLDDRAGVESRFPAPTNYRATAGTAPDGRDGPFAPGQVHSFVAIEAGDGLAYTAAFSERLIGRGRGVPGDPRSYALTPGPVGIDGCPEPWAGPWHGDAGSDWSRAGWPGTLYNHLAPPGTAPSCIAADGRTARLGASSGHARGVNVLLFDLSLRVNTPGIEPRLWQALATVRGAATGPEPAAPSAASVPRK